MSVTIRIDDSQVRTLIRVMQAAGPDLFRDMSREVRTAARPTVNEMRSTVSGMSLPATSTSGAMVGRGGTGGITRRIASATDVSISGQGIRIKVNEGALGPASKLPAYMDAGQSWRHPVFGNRRAWVSQRASQPGWFTKTAYKHHPQIKQDVTQVLVKYAAKLAARI